MLILGPALDACGQRERQHYLWGWEQGERDGGGLQGADGGLWVSSLLLQLPQELSTQQHASTQPLFGEALRTAGQLWHKMSSAADMGASLCLIDQVINDADHLQSADKRAAQSELETLGVTSISNRSH